MPVYSEEHHAINIGNGLYTAELASSIPDGYVPEAYNLIASGETLENRQGFIQTTIDFKINTASPNYYTGFNILAQFNPDRAILGWGQGTALHFIRSSHGYYTGLPSGDGYMNIAAPGMGTIYGMAEYNDRTYVAGGTGIYAITAYNWSTDAITFGAVAGSPTELRVMISYKDRLWGAKGDKLYFTEPASIAAPYPETWNTASNFIPFRTDTGGSTTIVQIVPLGNRLLVFTTAGAYTILVEGPEESWIKKPLDAKSNSSREGCAFEAQGIVYYVNQSGVFASNGLSTAKLSGTIEDVFKQPNINLRHGLFFFEDGMLLVISKLFKDGSNATWWDSTGCRLFYSKLDPVAWTEWGSEGNEDYPSTFGAFKITDVMGVASNISTFLSLSPITLLFPVFGNSTIAAPVVSAQQLCVYDGYQNQLIKFVSPNYTTLTEPVKVNMVTRFTDFGEGTKDKHSKYGYVDIYTSDTNHNFVVKFVVDGVAAFVEGQAVTAVSVGDNVNLVRVPAKFVCRRVSAVLASELQSTTSQIKIKNIHLIYHTTRNESENVR